MNVPQDTTEREKDWYKQAKNKEIVAESVIPQECFGSKKPDRQINDSNSGIKWKTGSNRANRNVPKIHAIL